MYLLHSLSLHASHGLFLIFLSFFLSCLHSFILPFQHLLETKSDLMQSSSGHVLVGRCASELVFDLSHSDVYTRDSFQKLTVGDPLQRFEKWFLNQGSVLCRLLCVCQSIYPHVCGEPSLVHTLRTWACCCSCRCEEVVLFADLVCNDELHDHCGE